jgi:hypothetical protein
MAWTDRSTELAPFPGGGCIAGYIASEALCAVCPAACEGYAVLAIRTSAPQRRSMVRKGA